MATTTPLSPFLLKGALVELPLGFEVPIPNVIVFQYNPEKITRRLEKPAKPTDDCEHEKKATTTSPFDPIESIEFTLELDATDDLEFPEKNPIALATGVSDRLAALQTLMYPSSGLLGNLLAPVGNAGLASWPTPIRLTTPVLLLVLGPGSIVPVSMNSFSVELQEFSPQLYTIRASVSISLQILQPGSIPFDGKHSFVKGVTEVAYIIYRKQQQALALANMGNNVESILGLLPI